jgi:hypothetical protein
MFHYSLFNFLIVNILFIPVFVEPMKEIPSQFSRICMIDGTGDKFEKVAENLTQKIRG